LGITTDVRVGIEFAERDQTRQTQSEIAIGSITAYQDAAGLNKSLKIKIASMWPIM
jgi:hypothetical protein